MPAHEHLDIAIVGGGAAGLATAIFAAESLGSGRGRIVVLDGAPRLGAKILVSGGGRCNVTHREVRPQDFHGHRVLVRNVLAALPAERTVEWFRSLGVELVEEETGKLFPTSGSARTVLDALLDRCNELGVELRTQRRVGSIRAPTPSEPAFIVEHGDQTLRARRIVLAIGGRSLPRTGSDGTGWRLAERLGHSVTPTVPALVPLLLDGGFFHASISGVSCDVVLTTRVDGRVMDRRTGSMLWTHFGVSGPVVLDASRFYTLATHAGRSVSVCCCFAPALDAAGVDRALVRRIESAPRASIKRVLAGTLPDRLAEALCRHGGVDGQTPAGQLSRSSRRALVVTLANLVLPVVADRGWNHAEVTAGGVPLAEVSYRTMESRCVAGLYLVGELLDCDGRIGGFNFQWAWSTGWVAGRAAASSLLEPDDTDQASESTPPVPRAGPRSR